MGFFGFFGKKPTTPEKLVIDFSDNKITVNNKIVDIPSHISVLKNLLGKPRKVVRKNKDDAVNPVRINFTWDDLGVYCYAKSSKVVDCIGIRLNAGEICPTHYPKKFFSGNLMIKGMPWFETIRNAAPEEFEEGVSFFKKSYLGNYSVVAEYVNFEQDDSTRTEKDYTIIEIQLNDGL